MAFFNTTPDGKLLQVNCEFWNAEVAAASGYSVYDLSEALYALCQFIRNSLTPDRLHGFDLESIRAFESE